MAKTKVLVQMSHMNNIGGIETAMWQLAKAFKSADITFLVNSIADGGKVALERLKTLHNVILDDELDKIYEADVALIYTPIMVDVPFDNIRAKKIYQFVHSDIGGLIEKYPEWSEYKWQPDKRISKVLAVSDTVQKALKDHFGVDSEIVLNIYTGPDERRVFLYMSRATKEKGLERTLKLLDIFDQAKKDYVLIICSRVDPYGELWPVIEANPRILYMPSSIYNDVLYRCADYLVQLSDLESWCYTLREAIANGVAILGNDIPEITKVVKDGENGYLLKPDLSNVDLDKIFNNVPKPTGKTEKVPAIWQKVMEGKL